MKKTLIALSCIALIYASFCAPGQALGADKVKFAASWIITGADAPYFVAKEKGFYEAEGIEVDITRGYGTLENAKRLDAGQIDFADADTGGLILARGKGATVKLIAMTYHKNPQAVVFRNDSGIKALKDLEGKKIGGFVGGANTVLFPALAKANNIDPQKVEIINMFPGTMAPALASKKCDATLEYVVAFPDNEKAVKQAGGEAMYLLFADYGVSIYGQGIATSDKIIKEKPDLVRRFLRASIRGRSWCLENFEEAIDIMTSGYDVVLYRYLRQFQIRSELTEDSPFLFEGSMVTICNEDLRTPHGQ